MLRCYTSHVENGHTVPSIETLPNTHWRSKFRFINSSTMAKRPPNKIKGLDLNGAKLPNSERREIKSLGRKFAKLKERDKGLVRVLVAKLAQAAS
jgi:hypothetical protein